MTTIKELNKKKVPIVRIDKSLNKYNDVVLFPDKVEKANEMLRTIGLPKLTTKKHSR
ncbi:MAG: hypothetical protein NTX03_08015 [Bacteroidetes bacterium]|nr:hypothetical protein [Bacteroidota bacterium]